MISEGDKTIIYTTQNGEKVALPPGNTPSVGDTVLVHRLPDGTLVTHGNSNIQVGDTVLVTRTQTGEYVAVKGGRNCIIAKICDEWTRQDLPHPSTIDLPPVSFKWDGSSRFT